METKLNNEAKEKILHCAERCQILRIDSKIKWDLAMAFLESEGYSWASGHLPTRYSWFCSDTFGLKFRAGKKIVSAHKYQQKEYEVHQFGAIENMVDLAKDCAQTWHEGQMRDNGEDYYKAHVKVVGEMVANLTQDEEVIAAAYLHDVLEDCPDVDVNKIKDMFGDRVACFVLELTKSKNSKGQKTFPRLGTGPAVMIKFCDRAQNLSTMGCWDVGRQVAYTGGSKFWRSE